MTKNGTIETDVIHKLSSKCYHWICDQWTRKRNLVCQIDIEN